MNKAPQWAVVTIQMKEKAKQQLSMESKLWIEMVICMTLKITPRSSKIKESATVLVNLKTKVFFMVALPDVLTRNIYFLTENLEIKYTYIYYALKYDFMYI